MTFANPACLWLLMLLPLLWLASRLARRPRRERVGSLIVWRSVERALTQVRAERRRVDWLVAVMAGVFALAVFAAAEPQGKATSRMERIAVLVDHSPSALLETPDGRPALALDALGSLAPPPPVIDLRIPFDGSTVEAWARATPADRHIVLSPRMVREVSAKVEYVTHAAAPDSLAVERAEVSGAWLYARVTRPGSEWILKTLTGEQHAHGKAYGHELLLELPRGSEPLVLCRADARTDKDRVFLFPRSPLRIGVQGFGTMVFEGLLAAFSPHVQISHNPSSVDFLLAGEEAMPAGVPRLRVAQKSDIVRRADAEKGKEAEHDVVVWRHDSRVLAHLDLASLVGVHFSEALGEVKHARVELGFKGRDGKVWPLVLSLPHEKEVRLTPELFERLHQSGQLPLLVAGACLATVGRDPTDDDGWDLARDPGATRHLAQLATPFAVVPHPGVYETGVVNVFAPPPAEVWAHELGFVPPRSISLGEPRSLAWPLWLAACAALGVALFMMLRRG